MIENLRHVNLGSANFRKSAYQYRLVFFLSSTLNHFEASLTPLSYLHAQRNPFQLFLFRCSYRLPPPVAQILLRPRFSIPVSLAFGCNAAYHVFTSRSLSGSISGQRCFVGDRPPVSFLIPSPAPGSHPEFSFAVLFVGDGGRRKSKRGERLRILRPSWRSATWSRYRQYEFIVFGDGRSTPASTSTAPVEKVVRQL